MDSGDNSNNLDHFVIRLFWTKAHHFVYRDDYCICEWIMTTSTIRPPRKPEEGMIIFSQCKNSGQNVRSHS